MSFTLDVLAATFRNATPLVYASVGDTFVQRAGMLNLGIEGMMFAGAFFGFAAAYGSGSLLVGLLAAAAVGVAAAALLGFLIVTLGTSQHVAGIGMTLLLIAVSEFSNRLIFGRRETLPKIDTFHPWSPVDGRPFVQYGLTYDAFFVVVPLAWLLLVRTSFALLVSFTLDIIAGRGWVALALVIFGRWRIEGAVIGALIFAAVYSLQLRL